MDIQNVGIIGLGLIGGSLAKALKRSDPKLYITALDMDKNSLSEALNEGVIDRACSTIEGVVDGVQLLFLCTPVASVADLFMDIRDFLPPKTIVTDVGSIKGAVMDSAKGLLPKDVYFIGGHPMAGTENSGYGYSTAHLFENAFYVLTPTDDIPVGPVQSMVEVISSIGAFPLIMDANTHDKIVGAVSHLPHVVAAALVNAVANVDDPSRFKEKLAAGGFRDITRIASSNPDMWTNISLLNRKELLGLTLSMIEELQRFYELLEEEEEREINTFYKKAKKYRDELPVLQSTGLLPSYDIYVDIEDRPGIIGRVTSLLGDHDINIRNTSIIHSRENEPGCLVISLTSNADVDRALWVLVRKGYRAYRR